MDHATPTLGEGQEPPRSRELRCVLVIDPSRPVEAFAEAMRQWGFEVLDFALVDLQPPDQSGGAVLQVIWRATETTADDGPPSPSAATRPEPLNSLRLPIRANAPERPRTVAERWAWFVLHVASGAHDVKTMEAWARSVGVSRSMMCECCRLVHITPRTARDFARMLRVVISASGPWQPETALDCADGRTLAKLLAGAGLADWPHARNPTPHEFLTRQRWIPHDNPGLFALTALLPRA